MAGFSRFDAAAPVFEADAPHRSAPDCSENNDRNGDGAKRQRQHRDLARHHRIIGMAEIAGTGPARTSGAPGSTMTPRRPAPPEAGDHPHPARAAATQTAPAAAKTAAVAGGTVTTSAGQPAGVQQDDPFVAAGDRPRSRRPHATAAYCRCASDQFGAALQRARGRAPPARHAHRLVQQRRIRRVKPGPSAVISARPPARRRAAVPACARARTSRSRPTCCRNRRSDVAARRPARRAFRPNTLS